MNHSTPLKTRVKSERASRKRSNGDGTGVIARWGQMVVGHGTKFGRKKEEAIAALLSQRTIEDAARMAKIGANTLLRWLQVPEFRDAYLKARRESVYQTIARLQQATGAAGATILKLMTDPTVPAAVRLRAAVFGVAAKGLKNEDIEVRISELERAAEESKPGWRNDRG